MIIHSEPRFRIIFGDKRCGFIPRIFAELSCAKKLLEDPSFSQAKKAGVHSLIFLHQTHSTQGIHISSSKQAEQIKPFNIEGDFIICSAENVAIGIATADCLPIIIYDKKNHIVALIHAGWRGSVNKVAATAFEHMQAIAGTHPEHVRVFFGPSAKRCCYSVKDDVIQSLDYFSFSQEVIQKNNAHVMFDLPLFNQLVLEQAGIARESFNIAYNECTIHTPSFHSYRREQDLLRQPTIVLLR